MATTTTGNLSPAVLIAYSKDILLSAQPVVRFEQFAVKKTDLSATPGLTVNFLRYNNLTLGGALVQGTAMTKQALAGSQVAITVGEFGNATSVQELLLRTSFDDVMASAATLLGFDYAKVLDGSLRDEVLTTPNVNFAGTATARNQIAATFYMDTVLIKDTVEDLQTNDTPKYAGDSYIAFVHPHQARKLRDDQNWINAAQYAGSVQIFLGELGMYEDVRFVSTTQMPILAGAGLAGAVDVYQAVMFGDNAYGLAWGLPVEMRDNGIEDFGREHSLAWYGIWGNKILQSERIWRMETA